MALVFISHATEDELLAKEVVDLLSGALTLATREFFLSSQAGRGVPPGHSVRDEIVKQIAQAKTLIVVVTPNSAKSPWVWLEVGCRMGCSPVSKPLFVVCSETDLSLLSPVADLRALRLDDDEEVQELVNAVAGQVPGVALDEVAYRRGAQTLREALKTAAQSDREQRAQVTAPIEGPTGASHRWWFTMSAVAVAVAAAALLADDLRLRSEAEQREEALILGRDTTILTSVSEYLGLNGIVVDDKEQIIAGATLLFSKVGYVDDEKSCRERESARQCTVRTTDSNGRFSVDLTEIQVTNKEQKPVSVTVLRPNLPNFNTLLHVDVRAMDKEDPPKKIVWSKPARAEP